MTGPPSRPARCCRCMTRSTSAATNSASPSLRLIYRNLLAAGEPGGGKSGLLNTMAAHAALSASSRMVLFDGKQVELGMWDHIADEFVGPDLTTPSPPCCGCKR